MHDLFNADHLHDKVEASLHQKNQMLVKLYNRRPIDVDQTTEELLKLRRTPQSRTWPTPA